MISRHQTTIQLIERYNEIDLTRCSSCSKTTYNAAWLLGEYNSMHKQTTTTVITYLLQQYHHLSAQRAEKPFWHRCTLLTEVYFYDDECHVSSAIAFVHGVLANSSPAGLLAKEQVNLELGPQRRESILIC